jgi:hypothetical protein
MRQINDQIQRLARDLADPIYPYIAQRLRANQGTAFPASGMAAGDLFFRTDYLLWFVYDGTRWVTQDEYALSPVVVFNVPTTTAPNNVGIIALPSVLDFYIERVIFQTFVETTNNGSNYYTVQVRLSDGTSITTRTTAADTVNTWTTGRTAPATVVTPGHLEVRVSAKTGAPGNLYLGAQVVGRIVAT